MKRDQWHYIKSVEVGKIWVTIFDKIVTGMLTYCPYKYGELDDHLVKVHLAHYRDEEQKTASDAKRAQDWDFNVADPAPFSTNVVEDPWELIADPPGLDLDESVAQAASVPATPEPASASAAEAELPEAEEPVVTEELSPLEEVDEGIEQQDDLVHSQAPPNVFIMPNLTCMSWYCLACNYPEMPEYLGACTWCGALGTT